MLKRVLAAVLAALVCWLLYSAIHNYVFMWGFVEGWNLAVQQCKADYANCVRSGK